MPNLDMNETISLLQELIRNGCVNPPGNEMQNIKSIEKFLKRNSISYDIFESAKNRGNLIAKIKGSGNGSSLMFGPSHVDVVPVENPEDWSVEPFSGEIKDGFVWGRGAIDMLFLVVAQIQAFTSLAKEGFKPKGDLILCIVSDEEAGGMFGTEWMIKNHPEQMKTDYAIGEHGGMYLSPGNLAVPYAEKGGVWLKLSFSGTPGHGSMPFGSNNAVVKAGKAAKRLSQYKSPQTTKYLKNLTKGMGTSLLQRTLISNKLFLPLILRKMIKSEPVVAKGIDGLTRMTISPNRITGGLKVNAIPSHAQLDVDIRTLPGQDYNYIEKHIKKALGKKLASEAKIEFLDITEGNPSFGNSSQEDSELVEAMKIVFQKHAPNSTIFPVLYPALTDLRFMRQLGANAYGFGLFDSSLSMTDLLARAHGTDERVDIKSIELTLKAHYDLAKEFLG